MTALVMSVEYSAEKAYISDHFHDCHQLIYVTCGSADITVSGKTYAASKGTMIIISRFEKHSVKNASEDYCRYTVKISPDAHAYSAPDGLRLMSLLLNRPQNFCHVLNTDTCQMLPLIKEIEKEYICRQIMWQQTLDMLFLQLLIYLCRLFPYLLPQGGEQLQLISSLQQYIEQNCGERLTLRQLANKAHLSVSHMSHMFKKITGRSVMGYLLDCRIAKAKQLLAQTDDSIADIVEKVGFTDSSNFSRTFKNITGNTPSDFRNKNR